jgi:amidase
MSPFGLGNDIGGSLRNPAYCCGIASLKPSIGRLPFVSSIEPFVDMGASGTFLTDGPMARSVNDLRAGLTIMAGRHIEDPQSVDAPLIGSVPESPKAALVKDISNFNLPDATKREIEKAGSILSQKGWSVEEVEAPEVERVYEIWGTVLNSGMLDAMPDEMFKEETAVYLKRFAEPFINNGISLDEALLERRRLRRLWSSFLTDYTVCIGPTWSNLPWPIDTDLDPVKGDSALKESFIFIAPGNCLGIPSVALPMGVADGLPTGIQIYSELYREDLCLLAAEIIEQERDCPTPIDPVK